MARLGSMVRRTRRALFEQKRAISSMTMHPPRKPIPPPPRFSGKKTPRSWCAFRSRKMSSGYSSFSSISAARGAMWRSASSRTVRRSICWVSFSSKEGVASSGRFMALLPRGVCPGRGVRRGSSRLPIRLVKPGTAARCPGGGRPGGGRPGGGEILRLTMRCGGGMVAPVLGQSASGEVERMRAARSGRVYWRGRFFFGFSLRPPARRHFLSTKGRRRAGQPAAPDAAAKRLSNARRHGETRGDFFDAGFVMKTRRWGE